MGGYDFGLILIFFIALFLFFGYPLYALITGKIIGGGKEYSKEKNPRFYWALIGLTLGIGIIVFLFLFFTLFL
jgi:hypothetical protein